ncbi:MAG: hypothetical protein ACYTGP_10760 [Planctomycetota bacterium]|jgi:hypothetical protein
MKMSRTMHAGLGVLLAALVAAPASAGTGAFTYQGRLTESGVPFTGNIQLDFQLWDAAAGGSQIGSTITLAAWPVDDGLFSATLDFGDGAFDGSDRWLHISADSWALTPRQKLTATPYADFAKNAPFSVNGSSIYYNDGELGIGTDEPIRSLHVMTADLGADGADMANADVVVESTDAQLHLLSDGAGTTGSAVSFREFSGGVPVDTWGVGRGTSGAGGWFRFVHTNGEVMRLMPDGRVGVGTTLPSARLHVLEDSGTAAEIENDNAASVDAVLRLINAGRGYNLYVDQDNASATLPAAYMRSEASSPTLDVRNFSNNGSAGQFVADPLGGSGDGVRGIAHGSGAGVYGISDTGVGVGVEAIAQVSGGIPLLANFTGPAGNDIAVFQFAGLNRARIDTTGRGYFNGGTQASGADVAEAFEVVGDVCSYEPGDVLVISTDADRTVTKSAQPYSTLVAGVHATKPGVLLTDRHIDDSLEDTVPMGVVGVIPTKVSAENGPIRRGDLLVTASLAAHAMKGTDRSLMIGAIIGKSLENFDGPGTGVIEVMVNVK